jgi:hypothetical protein
VYINGRSMAEGAAEECFMAGLASHRSAEPGWRQNNRVEKLAPASPPAGALSPTVQEPSHAARFCSVFSTACDQFRPGRHAIPAPNYRTMMRRRWREWVVVSETTAFTAAV